MKGSKVIIATLFLFSLASLSVICITPDEDDSQMEMMNSLFQEMGLDKAEYMTRENLRTILDKLLSKMYTQFFPNFVSFFKTVIEKYTVEVPEKFPRQDIAKYLTQERLMKIMQEAIKENYGEDYAEDLKPAFDEYEESIKEGNHLQNEEDVGQSANLSEEVAAVDQTPNQENQDL